MRWSQLLLVVPIVLGGVRNAAAQPEVTLTLDEALRRATEAAPRVAEIEARAGAADARVEASARGRRPIASVAGGLLRTNHVDEFGVAQPDGRLRVIFPDIPTNYRARAEVSLPIDTGRVSAAVTAAEADRRASRAEVETVRQDVHLETIESYWSLVTARERVTVRERSLDRADAWLSDVRASVEAGLLPPNDVLTAEAQRAHQAVGLIQAEHAAALAELSLVQLVGLDPGTHIVPATPLTDELSGAAAIEALGPDGLLDRARTTRPERETLDARAAAATAAGAVARAARLPAVSLTAALEPARPNARFVPRTDDWQTSWDLGATVSWSLWDGGRSRAEEVVAAAQATAVRERLREFDDRLEVEVRARLLELEATRAALSASAEGVAAATEARRVVEERFSAGVATSRDVLDAQVDVLEAELERSSLLAALRAGEARLLRTAGALP